MQLGLPAPASPRGLASSFVSEMKVRGGSVWEPRVTGSPSLPSLLCFLPRPSLPAPPAHLCLRFSVLLPDWLSLLASLLLYLAVQLLSFLGPSSGPPFFFSTSSFTLSQRVLSYASLSLFLCLPSSFRSQPKYLFLQEALLGPQPSCPCGLYPPGAVSLLWMLFLGRDKYQLSPGSWLTVGT